MIRLEMRIFVRSRAIGLGAMAMAMALAACGGGSPDAKSPARAVHEEPEAEASSVEEAQQQIAAARAELARAPMAFKAEATHPSTGSTTVPTSPGSSPAPSADARKAGAGGDDRCASPCRALASMRRAVGALCRMTGADDARCLDAKRTLSESEGRAASCSC